MTPQKWNMEKVESCPSLRTTRSIKGTRQKVIVTHNPREIDQNQLLLVWFPNLGSDDIIIRGMVNLSFNIKLSSMADPKRALVTWVVRSLRSWQSSSKGMRYWAWTILTFCMLPRPVDRRVRKAEHSETRHNP